LPLRGPSHQVTAYVGAKRKAAMTAGLPLQRPPDVRPTAGSSSARAAATLAASRALALMVDTCEAARSDCHGTRRPPRRGRALACAQQQSPNPPRSDERNATKAIAGGPPARTNATATTRSPEAAPIGAAADDRSRPGAFTASSQMGPARATESTSSPSWRASLRLAELQRARGRGDGRWR
jgi:hypothetical protein